jgi:FtsP/CotA-like multicopper oxidase with cupredoxin domain
MMTRREMIAAAAMASGAAMVSKVAGIPSAAAAQPQVQDVVEENRNQTSANTPAQSPGVPGRDYTPVYTPNGTTLPFKVVDGVKVMHLVAGEVLNEFAAGLVAHCWGYNGRTPGPTIEAVAGDRVRIYVTNRLFEPTTVHWHGIRIINGMDGVNGLTQEATPPGQTFKYEFTLPEAGTFMYHPHFDEMTQQAMGMMGMFIVHPRQLQAEPADRDYVIMLSEWRIDPGASRPVTTEMTEFNILTMNSKAYPGTQPLVAKLGERVRIRFGNLGAMDHHPIHLHGFQMTLVETDGGLVPKSARYAANTFVISPGSTRAVEFIADNPGDWPLHCHMTHHVMNQMGHNVPNLIGVDASAIDKAVQPLVPGYMTMGTDGMGDMGDMGMAVPKNSIPMLGGKGQFGTIDMGGMFTLVKVREELTGYDDPGDYKFPSGTVSIAATSSDLHRDGIDVNAHFDGSAPSPSSMMPAVVPTTAPGGGKTLYTCVMHPQVISDKPGNCPICGMKLVPKSQ